MADLGAVVPYDDPHDTALHAELVNLLDDSEIPNLDENLVPPPLVAPLDFPDQVPQFDEGIQDVDNPLNDPQVRELIEQWNKEEGSNSQAENPHHPPLVNPPIGDNDEQNNQGFGDVMPLSTWPAPIVPFNCSCCQVLREIIHCNSNNLMRLEVHGRLGLICHAILQRHSNFFDVNSSGNQQYQMFDFCKKSIEEVKQFLMQYCLDRKAEGYIMQQDPLALFYEALCVGLECADILNTVDFDLPPPPPPNPGIAGEAGQPAEQPAHQPAAESNEVEINSRISLSAQRERTAHMTLQDLRDYFHLPIEKAARRLRVCPTVVKKICRRNGLSRWPSRKIRSINRQISKLRPSLESDDAGTRVYAESEISRLERQIIELVL